MLVKKRVIQQNLFAFNNDKKTNYKNVFLGGGGAEKKVEKQIRGTSTPMWESSHVLNIVIRSIRLH